MPIRNAKGYYIALGEALEGLYQSEIITLATRDNEPKFTYDLDVFEQVAKWISERGGFTPDMLAEQPAIAVMNETFRILGGAVSDSIAEEVPKELVGALENNAFIFSGLKTFHSLNEVGLSLVDDKGGIKPFETFRKDVAKINEKYNDNYLYAEYNHAVTSSQMAAKWHDFEQDGDRYDLQYRTAGDERVRAEHQALHNITLPPSDPFWSQFLPPNGWNCRCTVVQVRKNRYKTSDSAKAIEIGEEITADPKKQIFRFNTGKELKLFPDKHPYFKVPPAVVDEINAVNAKRIDYEALEANSNYKYCLDKIRINYKDVAPELNDYEKAAIHYYSKNGYKMINRFNRRHSEDSYAKQKVFLEACSKTVSSALKKKNSKYVGVVHRITNLTATQIANYKKCLENGTPICEKHFLSSSYVEKSQFEGNVKYQIHSKNGAVIEDISTLAVEKEVMFDRNTYFTVKRMKSSEDKTFIELEEI